MGATRWGVVARSVCTSVWGVSQSKKSRLKQNRHKTVAPV